MQNIGASTWLNDVACVAACSLQLRLPDAAGAAPAKVPTLWSCIVVNAWPTAGG